MVRATVQRQAMTDRRVVVRGKQQPVGPEVVEADPVRTQCCQHRTKAWQAQNLQR